MASAAARSLRLVCLVALVTSGCVARKFVPSEATLLKKGKPTFNRTIALYQVPGAFVVVETRQLIDPGNSICRALVRGEAEQYFKELVAGGPGGMDCPGEWEWR